jgi:stage II sporulation protein D
LSSKPPGRCGSVPPRLGLHERANAKKMRRLLVAGLILSVLALPTGAARAADSFTFFGSGWGHGLGLSQWGAYGLSLDGWESGRILRHFYRHTEVEAAESPPARLRIGLVQGKGKVRLAAESGAVELRLGTQGGETIATIPGGETWVVRVVDGAYKVIDQSGHRVASGVGGPSTDLFAVYQPNGARVRVPEAGHTYNRGWIEFNIYRCSSDCRMRLVLSIAPQDYLYGISEVPSSWPRAALEAQSIAARTYALRKVQLSGQHRAGCNCALYASAFDQVYAGWDKEGGPDGERWVAAVNATDGRVVTHQNEMIQAFYASSSGGHTENNENVWGGTPLPYLRGVCDPGDYTSANPNAVWKTTMTAETVTRRLGLGVGRVRAFTDVRRGVSGRIVTVTIVGRSGRESISGGTLRARLGLRDDRVWINANRQVIGTIRQKYDAVRCRPGLPKSRRVAVAGGARQTFQQGQIFVKDSVGAHLLSGAVLRAYLKEGGPSGWLGFPTTDSRRLADGSTRARFEHGVITCTDTGCRASAL